MEVEGKLKEALDSLNQDYLKSIIESSDKYHSVDIFDVNHFTVKRYKSKKDKTIMPSQKVKIGRFLRNVLLDYDDSEIEYISNSVVGYNKVLNNEVSLDILKGDDILSAYDIKNYHSISGTIGNSCMRYTKVNNFMRLYSDNECCSILVFRIEGKIISRALLWTLDDGNKFLDRVYTSYDYMYNIYERYAKDNGFIYTKNGVIMAHDSETDTYVKIKNISPITINNIPENFPYLDTFSILYVGKLYHKVPELIDNNYTYLSLKITGGIPREMNMPLPLERGILESYRGHLSRERLDWLLNKVSYEESDIQYLFNLSNNSFISLKTNLEKIINTNSDFPSSNDELQDILIKDDIGNFKLGLYKSINKAYPEHFYNEDGSVKQDLLNQYDNYYLPDTNNLVINDDYLFDLDDTIPLNYLNEQDNIDLENTSIHNNTNNLNRLSHSITSNARNNLRAALRRASVSTRLRSTISETWNQIQEIRMANPNVTLPIYRDISEDESTSNE